jgi:hypothetical protein
MTINLLTKVYTNWIEKNNLSKGCAEELHYELLDNYERNKPQIKWLQRFINLWEKVEHKPNKKGL